MNIALIGYGKMGKAIESIAVAKGHTVGLRITSQNLHELTVDNLRQHDVAIEFSNPHSAIQNMYTCFEAGIPVVCGSTGWTDRLTEVKKYLEQYDGSLLYASNFSVGVNIFFEINKKLASLMADHPEYAIAIEEIHHTAKKDAPSGTAISLAEQVIAENPVKKQWVNHESANPEDLAVISQRIDPAPGTHYVRYISSVDNIEIIHTAHNREGFASGAVLAAEFLQGKKGLYSMKDVLKIR